MDSVDTVLQGLSSTVVPEPSRSNILNVQLAFSSGEPARVMSVASRNSWNI